MISYLTDKGNDNNQELIQDLQEHFLTTLQNVSTSTAWESIQVPICLKVLRMLYLCIFFCIHDNSDPNSYSKFEITQMLALTFSPASIPIFLYMLSVLSIRIIAVAYRFDDSSYEFLYLF